MSAVKVACFYASSSRTGFMRNGNYGEVCNVAVWNTGSSVVQERRTTTTEIKK